MSFVSIRLRNSSKYGARCFVVNYLNSLLFCSKLAEILLNGRRVPSLLPVHKQSKDSSVKLGTLMAYARFPAISRLQKIYNCELALRMFEAFNEGPLQMTSGRFIEAKDLVDGHREVTLSLLWRLLLHLHLGNLVSSCALNEEINRLEAAMSGKVEEQLQCLLMKWAQSVVSSVRGRKNRALSVTSLDESFVDGRVFCAILNFYCPFLLPWNNVRDFTTTSNLDAVDIPHRMRVLNNRHNLSLYTRAVSVWLLINNFRII